jgi:carbamate kinase
MIEAGWTLVVTHGNGPQVGYILRRNELAAHEVHATPLDVIVADTQGSIGYMLQQALHNELYSRGLYRPVVSVVTQVLVDGADPAFQAPNKPIGGFMEEAEARKFEQEGWQVVEDAGRGWRRVVASPEPLRVVEEDAVRHLVTAGSTVIAVGGGGIPVVQNPAGELRELKGVFAVIDKDRASSLLACQLKVDLFLVSTGVEYVALYYNTPQQINLGQLTVAEAEKYLAEGHFAPGSMAPKIQAAIRFVRETGNPALITNPPNLARALNHETGTWIVAN